MENSNNIEMLRVIILDENCSSQPGDSVSEPSFGEEKKNKDAKNNKILDKLMSFQKSQPFSIEKDEVRSKFQRNEKFDDFYISILDSEFLLYQGEKSKEFSNQNPTFHSIQGHHEAQLFVNQPKKDIDHPYSSSQSVRKQLRRAEQLSSDFYNQELRNLILSLSNDSKKMCIFKVHKDRKKSRKYFFRLLAHFSNLLSNEFVIKFKDLLKKRFNSLKEEKLESYFFIDEVKKEFEAISESVQLFRINEIEKAIIQAFDRERKKMHQRTKVGIRDIFRTLEEEFSLSLDYQMIP